DRFVEPASELLARVSPYAWSTLTEWLSERARDRTNAALVAGLDTKDRDSARYCTDQLAAQGDAIVPLLWPVLGSSSPGARSAAAALLERLPHAGSQAPLQAARKAEKVKKVAAAIDAALAACTPIAESVVTEGATKETDAAIDKLL